MPPSVRIRREEILRAAFELVREEGAEALNVRAVAKRIGCSTQPVMYHFHSVAELKKEVYIISDEYHTRYLTQQTEPSLHAVGTGGAASVPLPFPVGRLCLPLARRADRRAGAYAGAGSDRGVGAHFAGAGEGGIPRIVPARPRLCEYVCQ